LPPELRTSPSFLWLHESQLTGRRAGIIFLTTGLNQPYGIAIDASAGKVYWSDRITKEIENNTVKVAFKGTSFVLSAGFLTWALRGASLLASVAASLPAWQGFDPLPVLAAKKRKAKAKDEDVDGGDENSGDDWQEKRLQRLLNPIGSDGEQ
jgi:hypothetical protein